MKFNGLTPSSGASQASLLTVSEASDVRKYVHNNRPMESTKQQAHVDKPASLPGTETPFEDQAYPYYANGQLPRASNGLRRFPGLIPAADFNPYNAMVVGGKLPKMLSPSLTKEEAASQTLETTILEDFNARGKAEKYTTREKADEYTTREKAAEYTLHAKAAATLLSLRAARVNPQPQIINAAGTAHPSPPHSQKSEPPPALPILAPSRGRPHSGMEPRLIHGRRMKDWQYNVLPNQLLALGIGPRVYPAINVPYGYARPNFGAPKGKRTAPTHNYLLYKYLSLVPGHQMASSKLHDEIIRWAQDFITNEKTARRSIQHSQCTNDLFISFADENGCTMTRLRRIGEVRVKGHGSGKKRKNDDEDDEEEEDGGLHPPRKKPTAWNPVNKNPEPE